ncbi:hypothetical protein AAGW18_22415 [Vreelandella titanicae]|uniref:hypothetical protein n=1 Tax=Vreelandella titanicae TaxID=664683 RepID=UPI0031597D4B
MKMPTKNKSTINPSDTVVSLGDFAFAGLLLKDPPTASNRLAPAVASFAHLLTSIVLSDRLLVLGELDNVGPPISDMYALISKHCKVQSVSMDDSESAMGAFNSVWSDPVAEFGASFCLSAIEAEQRLINGRPFPEATRSVFDNILNEPSLARIAFDAYEPFHSIKASLAEYSVSQVLSLPFLPNPVLSIPMLLHELRERTAKQQLVTLIDQMRQETASSYRMTRQNCLSVDMQADIYCLPVPAIVVAILNESDSPESAVRTAAEMSADAAAFRKWCESLESLNDPKDYLERLLSARATLERLGRIIGAKDGGEMTLSVGAFGTNLPAPTIAKLIDYLNVDVRFFRPRRFLLNVLSQARQIASVEERISLVFGIEPTDVSEAAQVFSRNSQYLFELARVEKM